MCNRLSKKVYSSLLRIFANGHDYTYQTDLTKWQHKTLSIFMNDHILLCQFLLFFPHILSMFMLCRNSYNIQRGEDETEQKKVAHKNVN